jgi:hypothetical protein
MLIKSSVIVSSHLLLERTNTLQGVTNYWTMLCAVRNNIDAVGACWITCPHYSAVLCQPLEFSLIIVVLY